MVVSLFHDLPKFSTTPKPALIQKDDWLDCQTKAWKP